MTIPSDYRGVYNSVTRYKKARYAVPDAEFLADQQWIGFDETTDQFGYYSNRGSPEGVIAANKGSWCSDTSNGAIYVKTTDTVTTGWKLLDSDIIDYHTAKFIVSSETGVGGQYTTIASAVAAAQATGLPSTIFIMPGLTGVYTENITLPANINLVAYASDAQTPNVTIVGNILCSGAGSRSISGIRLQTNSNPFLTVVGSDATVVNLNNCYLNCTNNTGISFQTVNASSNISIYNCKGDITTTGITLFSKISTGRLDIYYCDFYNSGLSTSASLSAAGITMIFYSQFRHPFQGVISFSHSIINTFAINTTCITATTVGLRHCQMFSGTASALSVSGGGSCNMEHCNIESTNANAITGAGTLYHNGNIFSSGLANINTTTQIVWPYANIIAYTTTSTTPYTVLSTDQFISVDASGGARTVRLPNAPCLYQVFEVKDKTGSAATNNITVTTVGGVINIDGATSYIINVAYGSAKFIWNGTSYEVH